MKYKVITLDIDGTLTNSEKVITENTKKALLDFQEKGGKIILASGRPQHSMFPYAETLALKKYGGYILAYNGCCVIDCKTGNMMFRQTLDRGYIPEICGIIKNYPVGIGAYQEDNMIVGNSVNRYTRNASQRNHLNIIYVENFAEYVDFDIYKCLLQGEPEIISELECILSEKYKDKLGVFKSEPFFLEIVPNGIDKAYTLDRLLKMTGFSTDECIACGDGFNDISMIKYAGLGVAMGNASDTVKKSADFITLPNDLDGIAFLLEKISV